MRFDGWDDVAAFALALPGCAASTSYRQPAIKVGGRMLVSTGHEAGSFHVRSPHDEKAVLIETGAPTFWQTPHYAAWPGLLVRYGGDDAERVALTIRHAWWDALTPTKRKRHGQRP